MQSTIDAELPEGVELRDLNDYRTLRGSIFGGVQKAFQTAFPISYGGTRMEVDNVRYDDEKDYTLAEQKKAILEDKYLTRKLKGTVRLYDEESGEMLDERDMPLMRVPWLTERNTFIHNGSEYATIMQSRLLPGVYTRRQNNGHLETQFNARPGAGKGFRIGFEPDTAQYRLRIAQANLHMYSLLKDLGIPDEELRGRWGDEVFEANKRKYDARVFDKAYQRLVPNKLRSPDASPEEKAQAIREALDRTTIHRFVAENNLPGMLSAKRASEQRAKWAGREAMQKQANAFFDAIPFEPDLTPAECWQDQWDWDFKKKAAVEALPTLLKAKEHSDKKQYNRKTALMILLLQSKPDEFVVDQEDPHFPGVTHVPTGFRIHVPKDIIPGNIGVIERASKEASTFEPDLDPDALRGEYNALYGKAGPRLASMQQWPDDWIPDSSNLGWLDWYFNYTNGERNDDDEKQIKRWKAFKARQGAQFVENPTPRRAFALRNWAIDPLKLLPNAKIRKQVEAQMAEYKNQAEEEWREKHAWFDRRELEAIADFLNKEHQANIPLATESSELLEQRILDHVTSEDSDTNAMLMDMGEDGLKKVQEEQSKMKPLKDPLTPSSLKSVFDSGNI